MVGMRRRRGLMGGTGGASARTLAMPLASEAPGGRSTVMTDEVPERKVGSEISCLLMDRLRGERTLVDGQECVEVVGLIMVGAVEPGWFEEISSWRVFFVEKPGATGEGRGESLIDEG